MNRLTLSLFALLAVSACCESVAAASPPGIDDLSQAADDGTRTLHQSVIVPAPIAQVWTAFTTTDGYRAWAAPVVQIDFRVGGNGATLVALRDRFAKGPTDWRKPAPK